MQAKRIVVVELDLAALGQSTAFLATPTDPREEINFHNIWGSVAVEPETAGANCQGTWVLFILRENTAIPVWSDAIVNNETNNAIIIACGVFSASNENPWTSPPINPKTSRTLQAGDNLALSVNITGITADSASTRIMLCAHTTRK